MARVPTPESPWPVQLRIPVQWGDMDAFQHVNNTVYLRWFESARIAYFERTGLMKKMLEEGVGPILARATVDFKSPVTFPDEVTASATVSRVGRTSFVMSYRVTSQRQGGAVVAEGEGVVVMLDYGTGEKVEVDAALRARIESLSPPAQAD
jgi:acyl-CoA thioester hydrolase